MKVLTATVLAILLASGMYTVFAEGIGKNDEMFSIRPFEGMDLDGDRLDDRFDDLDISRASIHGRMGIILHFDRPPSDEEVRSAISDLEISGASPEFHRIGKHVNAIYATIDAERYVTLKSVKWTRSPSFIEFRPPQVPMLDVSSRAVRARPSDLYSPLTAGDLGFDGSGINIAVLDTGVDNTLHESFRSRAVYGVDFTGATVIYGIDPDDIDGHGTHVAGTALGTGGQSGNYQGVAPGAGLIDLRISKLYGDISGNLEAALEWLIDNHADREVRIASISFGSTYTSSGTDTISLLANRLVDEGVVVVVAAGNGGVQGFPTPAAADSVITVGASNDRNTVDRSDDGHESFSNRGPRASDGDQDRMDELKPDVMAPGRDIISAQLNSLSGYVEMTGTSMSCPGVSGVIALMLQANPALGPSEVKWILRTTAQQTMGPSRSDLDPKYNYRSGWGSVDAYGAVKRAMDLKSASVVGPEQVQTGRPFTIDAGANYTRTQWVSGEEGFTLRVSSPTVLGRPEIEDKDSGMVDNRIEGPYLEGSLWVVEMSITGIDPIGDVAPRMVLKYVAPSSTGISSDIGAEVIIAGISTGPETLRVTTVDIQSPPDLSIVPMAIWFSQNIVNSGDRLIISVRVNNTGAGAEQALVRVIDGPARTGTVIGEVRFDVPESGYAIASFEWIANPGLHIITVVADPENEIIEANELNNTAERPITVLGFNPPPVAQLAIDPEMTTVMSEVEFDGSASYDTSPIGGNVVSYNFDFGDGTGTGWIDEPIAVHSYLSPGTYTASLKVMDNGGAQSQNDDSGTVEVLDISLDRVDLYLEEGMNLTDSIPADAELTIGPGNGGPHDIGAWSSEPFPVDTQLISVIRVELHISGNSNSTALEVGIEDGSGGIIGSSSIGPLMLQGDTPVAFTSEIPTQNREVLHDQGIVLYLSASTEGTAYLRMGSDMSRISLYPAPSPNEPPTADAGEDIVTRALEPVSFLGSGTDPDGELISARWDVDGDGIWEAEGPEAMNLLHPGYGSPGTYTAVFEVRDDRGWWARDTAEVTVYPYDHNFAPLVTIDCPGSEVVSGMLMVRGSSSDDDEVERVEVSISSSGGIPILSWTGAEGVSPWTFNWDTMDVPNGDYSIDARAFDGQLYSKTASCSVRVMNEFHRPEILSLTLTPDAISESETPTITLVARVRDIDLPDDELSAEADLSDIGGPSSGQMRQTGEEGDIILFNIDFTPIENLPPGDRTISVFVTDSTSMFDAAEAVLKVRTSLALSVDRSMGAIRFGEVYSVSVRVEGYHPDLEMELFSDAFVSGGFRLQDDGRDPDLVRGDGIYTGSGEIASSPGEYVVTLSARDSNGTIQKNVTWTLTVMGPFSEDEETFPLALISGIFLVVILLLSMAAVALFIHNNGKRKRERSPALAPPIAVEAMELPFEEGSVEGEVPGIAREGHEAATVLG